MYSYQVVPQNVICCTYWFLGLVLTTSRHSWGYCLGFACFVRWPVHNVLHSRINLNSFLLCINSLFSNNKVKSHSSFRSLLSYFWKSSYTMFSRLCLASRGTTVRSATSVSVRIPAHQVRHQWSGVPMGPPDPILGVTYVDVYTQFYSLMFSVAWRNDPHPDKLNLGVGAYRDDNGNPFVLECVKEAEKRIVAKNMNHEYTPIGGTAEFTKLASQLLFHPSNPLLKEGRVSALSSSSLRLDCHRANPLWYWSSSCCWRVCSQIHLQQRDLFACT